MKEKIGSRPIVMVVENELAISKALEEWLSFDYDVVTASDGQEAILKIEALPRLPCAIFLDLMMAGMNGIEFLKHARATHLLPGVRIAVITASKHADIKLEEQDLLKDITFVTKPFGTKVIDEFVRAAAESQSLSAKGDSK